MFSYETYLFATFFLTIWRRSRWNVGGQNPLLFDQIFPELKDDEPAEKQEGPEEPEGREEGGVLQRK